MSTARIELLQLLTKLPGLDNELERKALITYMGYSHIGIYLKWSGSQVEFGEALIGELSRRGQRFMADFLEQMQRAPQVSADRQPELEGLWKKISDLPTGDWQQEFPIEVATDRERTALVADLDMLATMIVSTILLPFYELGSEEMEEKAGAHAVATAINVSACVDESVSANPLTGSVLAMFKQSPKQSEAEFLKAMRAMLGQDDTLPVCLAEVVTALSTQEEPILQAMVTLSQKIRSVQSGVVGAIVGNDVLRRIGVQQNIEGIESGGAVAGAIVDNPGSNIVTGSHNTIARSDVDTQGAAYVGGSVNVASGDFVGRNKIQRGDTIKANVTGSSNVAVGKNIRQQVTTTSGLGGNEIAILFEPLLDAVAKLRPAEQTQAQLLANTLIDEISKGNKSDDIKIARTVRALGALAPAAATVAATVLGSQVLAGIVGPVTQFAMEEWHK